VIISCLDSSLPLLRHRPIDAEIADVGSVAGGRVPLAGQAAEIIDESTTAVEVVSHLDCESYATEDQYPEWVDCKPFGAMLKSVLLAELTGASNAAAAGCNAHDSAFYALGSVN
jgi:hypothetical protein